MRISGANRYSLVSVVLLAIGLMLAACGDDASPTATKPKDVPKDRVLFLSNRDGWPDLYTIDQSGKSIQRLTESAAAEYGAIWSADGKRVAFTELEGDQASGDYAKVRRVVTVDADGKNRKLISNDAFNPAWSPDSSKILFVRSMSTGTASAKPTNERYSANIMAAPEAQITSITSRAEANPPSRPGQGATAAPTQSGLPPRATPNPNAPTPAPTQVVIQQPPLSTPTRPLPVEPEPTPKPGGTTDSAKIKGGLYIAPSDGSAAVRGGPPVTLIADNAVEGMWSPDGKKIVYISGNNELTQKRSLFLMDTDGSNKVSLTDKAKLGDLDILHAAWSPDGAVLAFTAVDTNRDRVSLYRLTADGNGLRRLTDYNGSARDLTGLIWAYADYFNPATRLHIGPVWSPNSRRIAFADGSATIAVIEADNGNRSSFPVGAAALGQDKDSVLNVSWLPDNRRLVYDRAAAGRNALLSQANFYIFDFFDETLEVLDTLNKNTSAIAGPGVSFLTPLCCGMDLLGSSPPALENANPSTKPKATAVSVNGVTPEGKLVYVSGVGQRQLIVNDLKTSERTIISSGLFKLLDFSLSPRSDYMIYLEVGDKYNATLYLSTLDGKQRRKLSEGVGEPDDLSNVVNWSPDGQQVAFQILKGDPNLKPGVYTLSLDAADNTAIAPRLITEQQVSGFSWSPDGRKLAYKVDRSYYELWVAALDGTQVTTKQLAQLGTVNTNYASLGKGVAWSPNGQLIAATGPSNSSRFTLWLVSTANGQITEVPASVISRIVGWTPDSTRLMTVVASFSQNTDIQLYNMNTRQWRPYGIGSNPQLSPDGLFAVYYAKLDLRANSGGPYNVTTPTDIPNRLGILQLANGDLRGISLDFGPYFGFKARFYGWSPDGKLVAYYYNNSIYGVATNGQNPQIIARAFTVDKLAWAKG